MATECRRLGVKYSTGTSGTFSSLLLSPDGRRCTGVKTADGTEWKADVVVMAAGAWSPVLIDLQGQCESKVSRVTGWGVLQVATTVSQAWIYAHLQLTEEEAESWRGVPTMYNNEYVGDSPLKTEKRR